MDDKHKKSLTRTLTEFQNNLNIEDVMPFLMEKEIMTESDYQKLQSLKTRAGKVVEFIGVLKTKGEKAYPTFIDALLRYETVYQHLVDKLKANEESWEASTHVMDRDEKNYPSDSDSDSDKETAATRKVEESFDVFLKRIGINAIDTLSLEDFLEIRDPSSQASMTLPYIFWQKLTSLDYRACLCDPSSHETFSMRDFIYAVLLYSDNFLRQDIIRKMSSCQIAVPVILPGVEGKNSQFILWALRGIVKKWSSIDNCSLDQHIAFIPIFTVSFLRIGDIRMSKSAFLNTLLTRCQGNDPHFPFLSRDYDSSMPLYAQGRVEAMWYLPNNKNRKQIFKDVMAFYNLRGDCKKHLHETYFACRAANLTIAFVGKNSRASNKSFFDELTKMAKRIIFVCVREQDDMSLNREASRPKKKGNWYFVRVLQLDVLGNYISKDISEVYNQCSQSDLRSLMQNTSLCKDFGIDVDQANKTYKKAEDFVSEVFKLEDGENVILFKKRIFPLQKLWLEWVSIDKEPLTPDSEKEKSFEFLIEDVTRRKLDVRKNQREKGLSQNMVRFKQILSEIYDKREILAYFMALLQETLQRNVDSEIGIHIRRLMEIDEKLSSLDVHTYKNESRQIMSPDLPVRDRKADEKRKELKQLRYEESLLCLQKNLGFEHFLRELGQEYISVTESGENTVSGIHFFLPDIAANLLKHGFALEIMDGESGRVPIKWVTKVLDELIISLNDAPVFVLGVIGVQSSGKSTLLNSMFGVQFPVRAGRCTSGLFLRVLKIDDTFSKKLKFRYLFLIDSEGLRSIDRTRKEEHLFDNQLVTFALCIADVTILNIQGENVGPEMRGLLQIAAHAHMRMKKVNLKSQCRIAQQRVTDVTAVARNKTNMNQIIAELDEATLIAAKEEGMLDVYSCFSDIFDLHFDDNTQYIPCLWNNPMSPPNFLYGETITNLRDMILKDVSKGHLQPQFMKLSHFTERIENVWEAVKKETFLFNFQDSMKAIAYNQLCLHYNRLHAKMRLDMINFRHESQRKIEETEEDVTTVYDEIKAASDAMLKEHEETILADVNRYINANPRALQLYHKTFVLNIQVTIKDAKNYILSVVQNDVEAKKRTDDIHTFINKWKTKLREDAKMEAAHLKNGSTTTQPNKLTEIFSAKWDKWVKSASKEFQMQKTTPISIRTKCEEILIRITSDMAVNSEIRSLLESEGGIEKHCESIDCENYLPSKLSPGIVKEWLAGQSPSICRQMISKNEEQGAVLQSYIDQIVEDTLEETIKQCSRKRFDANIVQFSLQNALDRLSAEPEFLNLQDEDMMSLENTWKPPYLLIAKTMLHICGKVYKIVQENQLLYEEVYSCEKLFEEEKENLCRDFIAFCNSNYQDERAVAHICTDITNTLARFILEHLKTWVKNSMLTMPIFSDNFTSIKCLLEEMGKQDKPENYISFIENPVNYLKDWIQTNCVRYCAEGDTKSRLQSEAGRKLDKFITDASLVIAKMETDTDNNDSGYQQKFFGVWIDKLIHDLAATTGIRFSQFAHLKAFHVSNVRNFKTSLSEFVKTQLKPDVISKLSLPNKDATEQVKSFLSSFLQNPEIDLAVLLIGCPVQCPMCGALCDQPPILRHKHSTSIHYPIGVTGKTFRRTSRLAIDFCDFLPMSPHYIYRIQGDDKSHHVKDIKKDYPYWSMRSTPHQPQADYWRWVFARHNKSFAKHYKSKPAKIPAGWCGISKEKALQSLTTSSIMLRERGERVTIQHSFRMNDTMEFSSPQP
ncbi:Interferon-induced very large GTPase 1 [Holothuria leucospilota]|uniref:Interferon-induced very large GTPase 1 n=1 Tax=Holothuria leucospilota TaxID=206669 RepID=A0A9Q1BS06_HOLLE|nr:Interferon-induced very large GTPase 1 [Holothuria leucospilota]